MNNADFSVFKLSFWLRMHLLNSFPRGKLVGGWPRPARNKTSCLFRCFFGISSWLLHMNVRLTVYQDCLLECWPWMTAELFHKHVFLAGVYECPLECLPGLSSWLVAKNVRLILPQGRSLWKYQRNIVLIAGNGFLSTPSVPQRWKNSRWGVGDQFAATCTSLNTWV